MKKIPIMIRSTGEGDWPILGKDFWDALSQSNINLEVVDCSGCAFRDRSYFNFCAV
jgi:hypothetical protein